MIGTTVFIVALLAAGCVFFNHDDWNQSNSSAVDFTSMEGKLW